MASVIVTNPDSLEVHIDESYLRCNGMLPQISRLRYDSFLDIAVSGNAAHCVNLNSPELDYVFLS